MDTGGLLQFQIMASHKTTKSRKGIRHLFKVILLFKENPSPKSLAFPNISLVRRGLYIHTTVGMEAGFSGKESLQAGKKCKGYDYWVSR